MPSLSEHQDRWSQALLSSEDVLASSLHPALAIHRNNFFHATRSALVTLFPTVEALVGEEFFAAMARDFIVASPPASPVITNYGADFPAFIEGYEAAQDLPYLPDVAVFEWCLHQVRHASDSTPLEPRDFAALAPEDLPGLQLSLIPAACLFVSGFAVDRLWRAHQSYPVDLSGLGRVDQVSRSLIVRGDPDLSVIALTHGEVILLQALEAGSDLGTATAKALDADSAHDVPEAIRKLASACCFRA